jgi:hypothetical protein
MPDRYRKSLAQLKGGGFGGIGGFARLRSSNSVGGGSGMNSDYPGVSGMNSGMNDSAYPGISGIASASPLAYMNVSGLEMIGEEGGQGSGDVEEGDIKGNLNSLRRRSSARKASEKTDSSLKTESDSKSKTETDGVSREKHEDHHGQLTSGLKSNSEYVNKAKRALNIWSFCEIHSRRLQKCGVQLIKEDSTLQTLQCLRTLLDNCLIRGYTEIPRYGQKITKELLRYPHGEKMLKLCGFRVSNTREGGNDDAGDGDNNSPTDIRSRLANLKNKLNSKGGTLKFTNKLEAAIGRCAIQFCLELSKIRGHSRWLEFDPSFLVPKDVLVRPRDVLLVYANPGKLEKQSSDWKNRGGHRVGGDEDLVEAEKEGKSWRR